MYKLRGSVLNIFAGNSNNRSKTVNVCVLMYFFLESQNNGAATRSLLVLFGADASVGVCHFDGQLLGAFHDGLALLARHTVRDFCGEGSVLHHQHFQLLQADLPNVEYCLLLTCNFLWILLNSQNVTSHNAHILNATYRVAVLWDYNAVPLISHNYLTL